MHPDQLVMLTEHQEQLAGVMIHSMDSSLNRPGIEGNHGSIPKPFSHLNIYFAL